MTSPDSAKKISRFELLEQLGEGGIGVVYKAMDPLLQKVVAIKVLNAGQLTPEQQIRFQNEARTLAELKHRNIPEIFNFSISEDGAPYLVMEFAAGKSLSSLLQQQTFLPVDTAVDITRQACDALACADSAHILHRDIKPANIIISDAGAIKIVDFGLAKFEGDVDTNQFQTKTGLVIGSPLYMSPERFRSAKIDVRSDIYSLGCVLFEMLTGEPPYAGETAMDTANMHLDAPLPLLPDRVQCTHIVRDNLQTILNRCLAKKPEDRFKTMRDLESALDAINQSEDEAIVIGESTTPKMHTVIYWATACIGLIIFVFAGRSLVLNVLYGPEEKEVPKINQTAAVPVPDVVNMFSSDDPWLVTNDKAKGTDITDEDFRKLANRENAAKIRHIHVDNSNVNGTGLRYLKGIDYKTIKINSPSFCDKALDFLPASVSDFQLVQAEKLTLSGYKKIARTQIKSVKLGNMRIPEGALKELAKMPMLKALYLRNETPVTFHVDPKPIPLMRNLIYLEITNFDITNKDLPIFCSMKNLNALNLINLDFDNSNLQLLKSLPNLRDLRLNRTKITSAALRTIEELKGLELIDITGCKNITDAEKLAFKIKHKRGTAREINVIIDGDETKNISGEEVTKHYIEKQEVPQ